MKVQPESVSCRALKGSVRRVSSTHSLTCTHLSDSTEISGRDSVVCVCRGQIRGDEWELGVAGG